MKRTSSGLAIGQKWLLGAVVLFVVGLGPVAASAQAATTATITGGTVNPTWTSGTVDNITVNYDGANPWTVIAGTLPAAFGSCGSSFSSWYGADPFPDQQEGWRGQFSSAGGNGPGTLNSGPIQLLLNGAYGQRFCIYVLESFHPAIDPTVTIFASSLLASELLTVETPPPPAPPTNPTPPTTQPNPTPPTTQPAPTPPTPTLTLNSTEAVSQAKKALSRKYSSFRRGGSIHLLALSSSDPAKRRYKITWRYQGHRYSTTVTVTKLDATHCRVTIAR
jgi:hypothetical protein